MEGDGRGERELYHKCRGLVEDRERERETWIDLGTRQMEIKCKRHLVERRSSELAEIII